VLVETTPPVGPAARFADLPLVARLSAGVLLVGAALFAFQRLRRGSGCVIPACPGHPWVACCTYWISASISGAQVSLSSHSVLQLDGEA